MDLASAHPNTLSKTSGASADWPWSSRRELIHRLLSLSSPPDESNNWNETALPLEGLIKAFSQPLTVEAFVSYITRDENQMGDFEVDFEDQRYQVPCEFGTERGGRAREKMLAMGGGRLDYGAVAQGCGIGEGDGTAMMNGAADASPNGGKAMVNGAAQGNGAAQSNGAAQGNGGGEAEANGQVLALHTQCEEENTRIAFQAQRILALNNPSVDQALFRYMKEIVGPVLRAFRTKNSKASVFHLCKVLDAALRINPEGVLTYLNGPRYKLCLTALFANLHCSVVVDTALNLMAVRKLQPQNPSYASDLQTAGGPSLETLKVFHKRLTQLNPMGYNLEVVCGGDAYLPDLKLGCADLVVRLLTHYDTLTTATANDGLQEEPAWLKTLTSPHTLDGLAKVVCSGEKDFESALLLLSTLSTLACKGRLTTVPSAPIAMEEEDEKPTGAAPTRNKNGGGPNRKLKNLVKEQQEKAALAAAVPEGRLARFSADLKLGLPSCTVGELLSKALAVDVAAVESTSSMTLPLIKHTSYQVSQSFSYKRMEMLKVFNNVLGLNPKLAVPWKNLVAWQGQYPNNSLLQNEFARTVQIIILTSPTLDELKPAIVECKLITQLVKRGKDRECTDHAHVIQCLNLIRLKSDMLTKQHWLVQYLKSHSGWLDFLPELKKQTQEMLRATLTMDELNNKRAASSSTPKAQTDTAAQALENLFSRDPGNPLMQIARQNSAETAKQEKSEILLDVELCSQFAKSLGFAIPVQANIVAGKGKEIEAVVDDDWSDDDDAPSSKANEKASGGGAKKKKNKKKKN